MTDLTATPADPSSTQIENEILAVLNRLEPDGGLIPLSRIERLVSGTFWAQVEAVNALYLRGEIDVVKVNGSTLIGLCDELCQQARRACAERGEQRRLLVL